jgi:hypothetical protein
LDPFPGQEIIKNEYLFTKSYLNKNNLLRVNADTAYCIGAKYVESKLMKEDVYLHLINKLRIHFAGKDLIYVPHRGENELKLIKIKSLGIKIEYFENIVEVEFLFRNEIPWVVCGFTSSVLVNIPKIYSQINVIVFQIDENLFEESYRTTVKNFYYRFNLNEGLKLYPI